MNPLHIKFISTLAALALVAGCVPKNIRVRCDAHLVPINPSPAASAPVDRSRTPPSMGARP